MSGADEEEIKVQCPYNKSHMILQHKMQKHLIKCLKSNPTCKDMKKCRFNATHIVPEKELKMHEKNCEDKINVYREMYQVGPSSSSNDDQIDNMPLVEFSDDENWNDEVHEPYNPKRAMANKPYIREVKHHTKSVRKQIREEHRRQYLESTNSQQ